MSDPAGVVAAELSGDPSSAPYAGAMTRPPINTAPSPATPHLVERRLRMAGFSLILVDLSPPPEAIAAPAQLEASIHPVGRAVVRRPRLREAGIRDCLPIGS
jgi:hypothetical protein